MGNNLGMDEEIRLEGGVSHDIEYIEELRLLLGSFLRPAVLGELLELYKVLEKEPKDTEMYAWFVRNSQVGADCKFARASLQRFKRERLDILEPLLRRCLTVIQEMNSISS